MNAGVDKAWTDEQIGVLTELIHRPARETAKAIDKSVTAVYNMRYRIKSGWEPLNATPWREDDLDFVRKTVGMPAREVAEALSLTTSTVNNMRHKLRKTEGIRFSNFSRYDPFNVGQRRLLAKTCLGCGLLLDASWFYLIGSTKKARAWDPRCTRCRPKSDDSKRVRVTLGRQSDSSKRLQELTLPNAKRKREPYLDADHVILRDSALTNFEKAIKLKRTYHAVCGQVHKHRYTSRVGKGDPMKGVWQINNPNEVAA